MAFGSGRKCKLLFLPHRTFDDDKVGSNAIAFIVIHNHWDKEKTLKLEKECVKAIQAAGAAIHSAAVTLNKAASKSSEKLKGAIAQAQIADDADSLFNEWKELAGIAKDLSRIEGEIRRVYFAAQEVSSIKPRMENLSFEGMKSKSQKKSQAKVLLPIASSTNFDGVFRKPRHARSTAKASVSRSELKIGSNPEKLLSELKKSLNQEAYVKLKRADLGAKAGIPKGSTAASFSWLLDKGYILEGEGNELKLAAGRF